MYPSNPVGLGQWLLLQYQRNKVEFYGAMILGVQLPDSGALERVQLFRCVQVTDIPCIRLVFATGAWIPRTSNKLLPDAYIRRPA